MTTLLVVIRDIASVQALVPVLEALPADFEIHLLADDIAQMALPRLGWEPEPLDEALAVRMARLQPDVVLTGTSIQPGIEKQAIYLARKQGIPSLAVLDSWTNYAARFNDLQTGERLRYVPDRLATFDANSVAELVALGIPIERIVVTGNPHFAQFQRLPIQKTPDEIRQTFDLGTDEALVLFISEPLADEWYASFGENFPSAEEITECIRLCGELVARHPRRRLLVKLHPIEAPALAEAALKGIGGDPLIIAHHEPYSLINAAQWVIGMNSNLLLESALAGYPTYSLLLPHYAAQGRISIADRFDFVPALRSQDALATLLASDPTSGKPHPLHTHHQQAVEAILRVIDELL